MGRCSLRSSSRSRCTSLLGRAILAMSVGLVAGCGGGSSNGVTGPATSTPVLTVVTVSLSPATLQMGQSAVASAAGFDQNGAPINIGAPSWSTASAGVATVSAIGVVSAVAPGQTMLIASVNGKQGQLALTVVPVPVAALQIAPGAATLAPGARLQLTAILRDASGRVLSDRTVGWASADAARVTVSTNGVVTAVAPGVATVTATSEGVSASAVITVTGSVGSEGSVATVTLSPAARSLTVGGSLQLDVMLQDDAGNALTGRSVTWSATVAAGVIVATVSDAGVVTAVSPGTVIVEAFSEGRHGAATITVNDVVDQDIVVVFAIPAESELVGDTLRLYISVKSVHPLVRVVAEMGRLATTLERIPVGARGTGEAWVGYIDITDLPTGPYEVMAMATDIRGAVGKGSTRFQRDTRKGKGGSSDPPKMK